MTRLIDLTQKQTGKTPGTDTIPVVVRSAVTIDGVPLEALVTLATVVDLTDAEGDITRARVGRTGVADIGGCILRTDWCDKYLAGYRTDPPDLAVDAAAYLLEGGVRTIAADFPLRGGAADLLLHNGCVLVYCLSNMPMVVESIVRLIALPLRLEDTYSAEARVIAIEA